MDQQQRCPFRRDVAGFFPQFPLRRVQRLFARIDTTCRQLKRDTLLPISVLAHHLAIVVHGDDDDRAGMLDVFAHRLPPEGSVTRPGRL